jgi:hypothetical protein
MKVSLGLLALGAALAIAPVASAQSYDFSFNTTLPGGNTTITVNGIFTVTPIVGSDVDAITAFTGNWVNTDPNDPAQGAFSLNLAGSTSTPGSYVYSPSGSFITNNQFYPNGDGTAGNAGAPSYFDDYGVLLNVDGYEANIWGNGVSTYQSYDSFNETAYGTITVSPVTVPESGSLSTLALSALALGTALYFKARQSGLA